MTTTASTSARGPSSSSNGGERHPSGIRARLRTTPARLWTLAVASAVVAAGLFVWAGSTLEQARNGVEVLGEDAGPRAMATTELYLALADMDAHMADVLLMGTDHGLGSGRETAEEQYEASRTRANEALLQAASLTEGDSIEERNVQAVLDGLSEYERTVGEALLLNDEAEAPSGEVDQAALERYREAFDPLRKLAFIATTGRARTRSRWGCSGWAAPGYSPSVSWWGCRSTCADASAAASTRPCSRRLPSPQH